MMTYGLTIAMTLGLAAPAPTPAPTSDPPPTAPTDKTNKLPKASAPADAADGPGETGPGETPDAPPVDGPPPEPSATDSADDATTTDDVDPSPFAADDEGEETDTAPRPEPASSEASASPATPATTSASTGITKSRRVKPDRPIRWRLDFALGVAATLVGDPGYLAFRDDRNLLGFDIGARWDYRIGQRFFLGAGAIYSRFANDYTPYNGLFSTDMEIHEPVIHGRASFMAIEGIDVFADLGGGPTIVENTVSSQQQAADERRQVTGTFAAMGGASLYLPKKWLMNKEASRVTAGFDFGFGYQFRGGLPIATDPSLDEEPLDTQTAAFGDLAMRGFVWRLGLIIRVM